MKELLRHDLGEVIKWKLAVKQVDKSQISTDKASWSFIVVIGPLSTCLIPHFLVFIKQLGSIRNV